MGLVTSTGKVHSVGRIYALAQFERGGDLQLCRITAYMMDRIFYLQSLKAWMQSAWESSDTKQG